MFFQIFFIFVFVGLELGWGLSPSYGRQCRKLELSPESESPVFYQLGSQIESRFFIPFTVITGKVRNKVTKRVIFVFLCERERERERRYVRRVNPQFFFGSQIESRFVIPFTVIPGKVRESKNAI
jgi:hypothetical protein